MNYPTPTNPLIVTYRGHILSMKNEHKLRVNKATKEVMGIGRSPEVRKFLTTWSQNVNAQMLRQGFDQIPKPVQVGCHVRIGVYAEPNAALPKSDNDNMYTSIQETWQTTLIDNDCQIAHMNIDRDIVRLKGYEFTIGFLWVLDGEQLAKDKDYPIEQFLRFYNEVYRGKKITELLPNDTSRTASAKV